MNALAAKGRSNISAFLGKRPSVDLKKVVVVDKMSIVQTLEKYLFGTSATVSLIYLVVMIVYAVKVNKIFKRKNQIEAQEAERRWKLWFGDVGVFSAVSGLLKTLMYAWCFRLVMVIVEKTEAYQVFERRMKSTSEILKPIVQDEVRKQMTFLKEEGSRSLSRQLGKDVVKDATQKLQETWT